jgi:hypothetical protein
VPVEESNPARGSSADPPAPAEERNPARSSSADHPLSEEPSDQEYESCADEDQPAEEVIPREDYRALKDALRQLYTVPVLKATCSLRGLATHGRKEDLINRLVASQNWASERNISAIRAWMSGKACDKAGRVIPGACPWTYSSDRAAETWLHA